jgi:Domain of Unknown Function (DUF1080)
MISEVLTMKHSTKRWLAALALAVAACMLGARLGAEVKATASSADNGQGAAPPLNQLTTQEKAAGWKLLFDGKSFDGWHNFKEQGVRSSWKVKDGAMVCENQKAGDIVTTNNYDWFELSLEYNIPVAGNSGIMFHITNDGKTTWATGPEIQLQDNKAGKDAQLSGWLYQLYKSEIDPKTQKPLDTTKPAGEWNHIRIVIAPPPAKSQVDMNGVKYYDFVYNSDDFKDRVAKSKFGKANAYPNFAKSDTGFIGLQGDHPGPTAFRNIKLKPIAKK